MFDHPQRVFERGLFVIIDRRTKEICNSDYKKVSMRLYMGLKINLSTCFLRQYMFINRNRALSVKVGEIKIFFF